MDTYCKEAPVGHVQQAASGEQQRHPARTVVLLPSWTDSCRKLSKRALGAAWMPSEPASSVLITSLRAQHEPQ